MLNKKINVEKMKSCSDSYMDLSKKRVMLLTATLFAFALMAFTGKKLYTDASQEKLQNSLKIRFILKPIFKVASVRVNSEAEKAGLQVGDKILKINHQLAHGYSIEKINELLKSEEGKTIEIEVERNNKTYKFKFQLKNII